MRNSKSKILIITGVVIVVLLSFLFLIESNVFKSNIKSEGYDSTIVKPINN